MKLKMACQFLTAMALLAGVQAHAAYDVYVYQAGRDVEAQGNGSIDLSALTPAGTGQLNAFIQSMPAALSLGSSDSTGMVYEGLLSGPIAGGTDINDHPASESSGDFVGIAGILHRIVVPDDYISGQHLTSSARWNDYTIADIGIKPGTYTWTWGYGSTQDSFTLHVGTAPAVIAPSAR